MLLYSVDYFPDHGRDDLYRIYRNLSPSALLEEYTCVDKAYELLVSSEFSYTSISHEYLAALRSIMRDVIVEKYGRLIDAVR